MGGLPHAEAQATKRRSYQQQAQPGPEASTLPREMRDFSRHGEFLRLQPAGCKLICFPASSLERIGPGCDDCCLHRRSGTLSSQPGPYRRWYRLGGRFIGDRFVCRFRRSWAKGSRRGDYLQWWQAIAFGKRNVLLWRGETNLRWGQVSCHRGWGWGRRRNCRCGSRRWKRRGGRGRGGLKERGNCRRRVRGSRI